MSPIVPNGRATRPSAIHEVVESQRTERHQAHHEPAVWGELSSGISWRAVALICAFWLVVIAAYELRHTPREVRLACGVVMIGVAVAAAWRVR